MHKAEAIYESMKKLYLSKREELNSFSDTLSQLSQEENELMTYIKVTYQEESKKDVFCVRTIPIQNSKQDEDKEKLALLSEKKNEVNKTVLSIQNEINTIEETMKFLSDTKGYQKHVTKAKGMFPNQVINHLEQNKHDIELANSFVYQDPRRAKEQLMKVSISMKDSIECLTHYKNELEGC